MFSKIVSHIRAAVSKVAGFLSSEAQSALHSSLVSELEGTIKRDVDAAAGALEGPAADRVKAAIAAAIDKVGGMLSAEAKQLLGNDVLGRLAQDGILVAEEELRYYAVAPLVREAADVVLQLLKRAGINVPIPPPPQG